jgi:hypothetical protein
MKQNKKFRKESVSAKKKSILSSIPGRSIDMRVYQAQIWPIKEGSADSRPLFV